VEWQEKRRLGQSIYIDLAFMPTNFAAMFSCSLSAVIALRPTPCALLAHYAHLVS